jgi:ABC-type phosphate transport system substrate-binding protein
MVAIFIIAPSVNAQDVVLIASSNVMVNGSISASDVQNIFLGKKTTWDDGNKITFITLNDGTTHETFLKNYIGKSSSQYKTFWKKQVFTGKGKMPESVDSDQDMVKAISGTTNAIGYVSAGTDIGSAKNLPVK